MILGVATKRNVAKVDEIKEGPTMLGRAGSGTAMVGLVEKAESMSPRMDNWGYDRWKAR